MLARYTYDALGNLIKVVENGSTRWTVYDGNRPVLDFDGSGTLTARYLQGPMVDEVLARDTPSGGVAWYLPNRLGTVRDIIDNSGTVLDHIAYGAYGQILSQSHASAGDRFGYAGMQTDATTGLYFDQARWYDPRSGRFISQDPIAFSGGDTNFYCYVHDEPTDALDPSGTQEFPPHLHLHPPIHVLFPHDSYPLLLTPVPDTPYDEIIEEFGDLTGGVIVIDSQFGTSTFIYSGGVGNVNIGFPMRLPPIDDSPHCFFGPVWSFGDPSAKRRLERWRRWHGLDPK